MISSWLIYERLVKTVAISTLLFAARFGVTEVIYFNGGDRLSGSVLSTSEKGIKFRSAILGDLTIPWTSIYRIQANDDRLDSTLFRPPATYDLVTDVGTQDAGSSSSSKTIPAPTLAKPSAGPQQYPSSPPTAAVLPSAAIASSALQVAINAPESVVNGTQSKIDVGGAARFIVHQPDLCSPASLFTVLEAAADHLKTYKVHSSAIITNTYDGNLNVENAVNHSASTSVYALADLFGNSSLGVGLQQSYGGGISHVFFTTFCSPDVKRHYDFEISGAIDLRYLHQRLYAPAGTNQYVGTRPRINISYTPQFHQRDGTYKTVFNLSTSFWVLPIFNDSKAIQAGGILDFKFPVTKTLAFTLGEEDDFINNAPLAKRKNYLKNSLTMTYDFPAQK